MGVHGVFLDEAGYDFGVTRVRQNAIVDYIHGRGLRAFVNAYNPDDVFSGDRVVLPNGGGNPGGESGRLGPGDAFLLESFQVKNGAYEEASAWMARTARAVRYRAETGADLFAVTTTSDRRPFSTAQFEYAWWSALLWSLDGFGWGEASFGSANSLLPWHPRSPRSLVPFGLRFTTDLRQDGDRYWRGTDRGRLVIDTARHTGAFVGEHISLPQAHRTSPRGSQHHLR